MDRTICRVKSPWLLEDGNVVPNAWTAVMPLFCLEKFHIGVKKLFVKVNNLTYIYMFKGEILHQISNV
jgi:hypothetical protein